MNTRRWLGIALAVGCISGVTVAMQYAGRSVGRLGVALAQSTPDYAAIKSPWSISLDGFRSTAFSPDDAYFSVVCISTEPSRSRDVAPESIVSLWRRDGKLDKSQPHPEMIWNLASPGATNAVVGPSGKSMIVFASKDPTQPKITVILGQHHESVYPIQLDGAVWDAAISGNGNYGAVVTGAHSLYLISLKAAKVKQPGGHMVTSAELPMKRFPLMGAGNSISISDDGSFLTAGTWDQSGVTCLSTTGKQLWQYQTADSKTPVTNRLFEAPIAQNGSCVLGVSYANVRQANAAIYLWDDKSGKPLGPNWPRTLDPDDSDPQVKISADGSHVALVYVHKIIHGDQSLPVHQLVLLDRDNNQLWPAPKGGPLMSPNLVAISPDGETITVTDGQRALYNFDADGRISAAKMDMSALIKSTVTSKDGRYVLVDTDDGKLTLVEPSS